VYFFGTKSLRFVEYTVCRDRHSKTGKESGTLREREQERSLWLTEEEAMGLLDVALLSPGELTPEQRAAILKLSEFCRQFLREPEEVRQARNRQALEPLRLLRCDT
jgi:hypothetical protein